MSKKNKHRKQARPASALVYVKTEPAPADTDDNTENTDTRPRLSSFDQPTQTLILWFLKTDQRHADLLERGYNERAGTLEISLRRQHRRLRALNINAFEVRLDA